jgi:hypothetical protein
VSKLKPICDLAGLSLIVAGGSVSIWALTWFGVLSEPWIAGMIVAPALVGAALYAWYASEKGKTADTEEWKISTLLTPLLGAIFFAIDVFIGSMNGHYANFVQAAFHAGSPFGIMLTVLICPIVTIICAGSWVRSSLLDHWFPKPNRD